MKLYLLRHGETAWNVQRRYQGISDIPLSPAGIAVLGPADFRAEAVVVSPLLRARQTAEILFPGAAQQVEAGLREMDFGAFEGRTAQEMEFDPDYRAWVEGDCSKQPPGGESREEFIRRTCAAFERVFAEALRENNGPLVIVAHNGTVRAVLSQYAKPRRDYFDWTAPNGGGWLLEAEAGPRLRVLRPICCAKDGRPC